MGLNFFAKSAQKFQKVPKSTTNEPNITTKILIAPRSGASGIAIVIFGSFVVLFGTF